MASSNFPYGWLYQIIVTAVAISSVFFPVGSHAQYSSRSIRDELGPKLSTSARIIDASSGNLTAATGRWQQYANPNINTVVEVATEQDVVETVSGPGDRTANFGVNSVEVLYANRHSISFLASSTGHGAIKSLAGVRQGIQISMQKISHVRVSGNTAVIGGGTLSVDVTNTLWGLRKQTGLLGPLLGGGHGFNQGKFGLAADNLIEARMVLANGSVITTSTTQHKDLFWAIRGAGHNFGIVTEVKYKIYDVPDNDSWYTETWIFDHTAIEKVFGQVNVMMMTSPAKLMNYGLYIRNPTIDPINPLLVFGIYYNGPETEAARWIAPFRDFKPLVTDARTVPYKDLPVVAAMTMKDEICSRGVYNRMKYGIYLDNFNTKTQRELYNFFNTTTAQYPQLNQSLMLFEGFPVQAPKAVPLESTAVAVRGSPFVVSPVVTYKPDPSFDQKANAFGTNIRAIVQKTIPNPSKPNTYVNYAFGDESVGALYGYESWRIDKLRKLKCAYDPNNRFRWYAPLGTET